MRWDISTAHPDQVEKLARELGVSPLVAGLFVQEVGAITKSIMGSQ